MRALIVLGALVCFTSGCAAGADGGPHPEPPDGLGPPASGVDGGVDTDSPIQEAPVGGTGGGLGGTSGGTGGAGGAAGVGGSGGVDSVPPADMDASIDGGWDDEDAGALR